VEENEGQKREEEERIHEEVPSGARKKRRKALLVLPLAILIALAAVLVYVFYFGHPSRQVLAQVNDEKITVEEFKKELAKVEPPFRDIYGEEPLEFLQGLIMKRLVLQEANKAGITSPVKTYRDAPKDPLSPEDSVIAELMKKKFSSAPTVTRKEIQEFYNVFKSQMEGKPLDQVAPAIEDIIREGKRQEEIEKFLETLRRNAKIVVNEDRLQKIAASPPPTNTEEQLRTALQTGNPAVVNFGANNCPPCRLMRPILNEIGKEFQGKATVLVIDIYKYQNLAREYKIQLIPTLVFFDAKGKEAFRHIGILEKEKIAEKLKEIGMPS
jgi:thioredoxin 1